MEANLQGLTISRVFTRPDHHPYDELAWEPRTASITGESGGTVFEQKDVEFPTTWSQLATNIVVQKYFRGQHNSSQREHSLRQLIDRVAGTITAWGVKDDYFRTQEDAKAFHAELTHLLVNQKMAFNSPVWFNVGIHEKPQCSACFINSVQDTMDSILTLAKTEGMLFKFGSGTGTNLSPLRSSKEQLSGGGYASGPVSFMKGFDAFAGVIKSGGTTRRAAKMVILNVNHPDIEQYIDCKVNEEKKAWALIGAGYDGSFNGEAYGSVFFQNSNNSVRVTDEFMQAVVENRDYSLVGHTGSIVGTLPALKVWRQVAEAAWLCGDPGIQFDTAVNAWHTSPATGRINASNPCQPDFATVLTPEGIRTFADIEVGSTIWSGQQWTKVVRKIETGIKPVNVYMTHGGEFIGTENHRVVCRGKKVEVRDADAIDCSLWPRDLPGEGDYYNNFSEYHRQVYGIPPEVMTRPILRTIPIGHHRVYDITVDAPEHTYWTGGLLVSNCSEYMYVDDSACNLASLNLRKFQDKDGTFQVAQFQHAIDITILAQEIIVGNSSYPTQQIAENSRRLRPLGLGYANLGALLMSLGMPYDSDEGRAYAAAITSLMGGRAYAMSAKVARDCGGPFADFEANREPMLGVMRKHYEANDSYLKKGRHFAVLLSARQAWAEAIELGSAFGFRNGQATVLAPTGTIGFMMDCDTTGIEPDIALVKYKRLVGGGMLKITNQTVAEALERLGYGAVEVSKIVLHIEANDTIEGSPLRPEHLPVFDCAFRPANGTRSIEPMGHVRMMAACQPFLSGAISKTVNMPGDATVEDIQAIYMEAWKLGLKAVAIYRDGCKRSQPLSTKGASEAKEEVKEDAKPHRRRLPDERQSITHKFQVGSHEGYVHVGLYDDGMPGELFITMSKEGSTISGLMDSFATAVSMGLQHGVPLDNFISKFKHTRFEPSGWTGHPEIHHASSVLDYLFQWLERKFSGGPVAVSASTIAVAEKAPPIVNETDAPHCHECGTLMIRSGACHKCANCGATSGCS